jgi:predicted permease
MARTEYFTELRQDVAYALRNLRRTPGFTAVAVASLALGIGATSAIFSVVNGVLLESLPYPAAERLYEIRTVYADGTGYPLSAPDFASMREHNTSLEDVEAYSSGTFTLLGAGAPREIRGASVSDGLFDLFGLKIAFGRGFALEDHQPGAAPVAVVDHDFWRNEFGADQSVIGRSVTVGGDAYMIVGVLASGARLPEEVAMYAPLVYDSTFSATTAVSRRGEFLSVFGLRRPDTPEERVNADLDRVGTLLQQQFPQTNGRMTYGATSLRDQIVGDVRRPLFVLFGAVAFVLLVACANVANLQLARVSARQEELAVRTALGAGRGRLVRQLLTESLMLGLAGGLVGLLIAYWGTQALIGAQPADIPRLDEIGLDRTVVFFTIVISLLTGVAFGVFPALQATGGSQVSALREGGRGGIGRGTHRVRSALVVAEMALAVVLLMGAGLLIRSFVELTQVDPGFRPERAMAFRIVFQGDRYNSPEAILTQSKTVMERLSALPGVTTVAVTSTLPLNGRGALVDFAVDEAPPPPNVNAEIGLASVTPDFFRAIGTSISRGRGFNEGDVPEAPRVALINEAAAKLWFPGEDPIGKRPRAAGAEREIIGVVPDVLQRSPGEPALAQMYVPLAQRTTRSQRFVLRGTGDLSGLVPTIRTAVAALDPNLPLVEPVPLTNLVTEAMARPRFYTSLLTLFAAVALILAAIGIFGVLSYLVAQRSREISIRMALGAPASGVIRMIVRHAMTLAVFGVIVGGLGAIALGRVLRSQLFGVGVADPATFIAVIAVLLGSSLAASYLPARRAAAMDPANVLREG